MGRSRKIIVHLPANMSDEEHADLANAVWAVAFGADSVEVDAPDVEAVNSQMNVIWNRPPSGPHRVGRAHDGERRRGARLGRGARPAYFAAC